MKSRAVTVTKLDHESNSVVSYAGQVIYRDDEMVVARCLWDRPGPFDLGPFCLEPGDVFLEYYYLGKWFNIFEIRDSAGGLKGWYCNMTRPMELTDEAIRWSDLALDLLVLPDGQQVLLDQDEFEALRPSVAMRARVKDALDTLRRWVAEGHTPFALPDAAHPGLCQGTTAG